MSHGEERIKCKDCAGEGSRNVHGSLKSCKVCGGMGTMLVVDEAHKILRDFRVEGHFTVSHEHSVLFKFRGYDSRDIEDRIFQVLNALSMGRIKTRLVFPVF